MSLREWINQSSIVSILARSDERAQFGGGTVFHCDLLVSILARSDERAQSSSTRWRAWIVGFQSSPALMSGRNRAITNLPLFVEVSILARSDVRAHFSIGGSI